MTHLQQLIYDFISKNQPVCDHCISEHLKKNQSQNINNYCRELMHENLIQRSLEKEFCNICRKKYLVNFS